MALAERGILEHVHRPDIDRDPDAHFTLPSKPHKPGKPAAQT
jgi:hypothetical protein